MWASIFLSHSNNLLTFVVSTAVSASCSQGFVSETVSLSHPHSHPPPLTLTHRLSLSPTPLTLAHPPSHSRAPSLLHTCFSLSSNASLASASFVSSPCWVQQSVKKCWGGSLTSMTEPSTHAAGWRERRERERQRGQGRKERLY